MVCNIEFFFIDKGFAPEKINEDRLLLGELFYFKSQSNIILNLDKSEVLTDGTSKLSGVRLLTNLLSADGDLPKGATICKKSGYSATFIGGSTLTGWPIPDYIQVKS